MSTSQHQSPTLSAALTYRSRGWASFPVHGIRGGRCTCGSSSCSSPGKHPWTASGCRDASKDPAKLAELIMTRPGANVGIATGAISGIVVIDVDAKSGGPAALAKLEAEHGDLPDTVAAHTGGGGFHLLFAYPDVGRVLNAVGKWPGIDVRGDGGYIVAPPSVHASGKVYRWAGGFGPEDLPTAPLPAWMREQLRVADPKDRTPRSGAEWSLMLRSVSEGGRNNALTRLAGMLFHHLPPAFAAGTAEILHAVNEARCEPALPAEEVNRIIGSIAAREADRRQSTEREAAIWKRVAAGGDRR